MAPTPTVDGKGTHGGYCGAAVKPIALNMVSRITGQPSTRGLEISAIRGIMNWRDAAEFIALGASAVQVCTAAILYGFRILDDMNDGTYGLMGAQGTPNLPRYRGPGGT